MEAILWFGDIMIPEALPGDVDLHFGNAVDPPAVPAADVQVEPEPVFEDVDIQLGGPLDHEAGFEEPAEPVEPVPELPRPNRVVVNITAIIGFCGYVVKSAVTAVPAGVIGGAVHVCDGIEGMGNRLLGARRRCVGGVIGAVDSVRGATARATGRVLQVAAPWRALAQPVVVPAVMVPLRVTRVLASTGFRVTKAGAVAVVDVAAGVRKVLQRRDDDMISSSLDILSEVEECYVPDAVMSGPAVVDENFRRCYDIADIQELTDAGLPDNAGAVGAGAGAEGDRKSILDDGILGGRVLRRKRHKWCRGKLLLVAQAQTQFPQRLDGRNPELVSRQVYEYMLRQANRLEWSTQDKADLPALAALAMAPGKGDREARKAMLSRARENLEWEHEVSGSRYPFAKRLYRRLQFWA